MDMHIPDIHTYMTYKLQKRINAYMRIQATYIVTKKVEQEKSFAFLWIFDERENFPNDCSVEQWL